MALNVLVVDDSAVMRAMIIRTLRLSRIPLGNIYEAKHGGEGLDALDRHWIDLALVDINMPVMNGEELIERVRARPELAGVRILVVSTEGSEPRIRRVRALGARFVRKPFTPEELRTEILGLTGELTDDAGEGSALLGSDHDF
jgi:two-component system chemotaxis response regulator CheY